MRLPIDTSQLTFMCAAPARPVTDFETKQHKADLTTGELLYRVQVVALDSEGAEIIQLTVAGDPKVGQGAMLKLDGPGGDAVVDGRPLGRVVPREQGRVDRRRRRQRPRERADKQAA